MEPATMEWILNQGGGRAALYDIWDAVVDAAGGGDYTSIQDALDNVSDGDTIWVKSGTYAENVNSARNYMRVYCEPRCVFTGTWDFSGDGVCVIGGSGCDWQTDPTFTGDGCSFLCKNGVDTDGLTRS